MENSPVCILSGRSDSLVMLAHRNNEGKMVGWFFVHKDLYSSLSGLEVSITHKVNSNYKSEF